MAPSGRFSNFACAALALAATAVSAFTGVGPQASRPHVQSSGHFTNELHTFRPVPLFGNKGPGGPSSKSTDDERTIVAAPLPDANEPVIDLNRESEAERAAASKTDAAATSTVNERLMAELAAASEKEKYGKRSKLGMKIGAAFRSERTDEERQRSIEEARNLNGVNPLVALGGSVFALGMAVVLWTATSFLADLFAQNPVETEIYTVSRLAGVFRNVVMGLFSLASGFAGVTGLGLLLLGVRVAYGVATGELDPTPIKKGRGEEVVLPNVWDLMMNKRPDRKGRRGGRSDDNPFGL